jgi:hypothetical protein
MAIASLVLGIVSIVLAFIPVINIAGAIAGIVGIILGAIARKQLAAEGKPMGQATAGLATSIIGTALSVLLYLVCAGCTAATTSAIKNEMEKNPQIMNEFNKALEEAAKQNQQ